MLSRIKELEHEGFEFEAAEASLALLISRALQHKNPPFVVDDAITSPCWRDGKTSLCEATIKGAEQRKRADTVAARAMARSMRSTAPCAQPLWGIIPQLKKVMLTDYKVRILESSTGTNARTRVLIQSTNGREEWGTVGVNDNIIEASLQAPRGQHGIRARASKSEAE